MKSARQHLSDAIVALLEQIEEATNIVLVPNAIDELLVKALGVIEESEDTNVGYPHAYLTRLAQGIFYSRDELLDAERKMLLSSDMSMKFGRRYRKLDLVIRERHASELKLEFAAWRSALDGTHSTSFMAAAHNSLDRLMSHIEEESEKAKYEREHGSSWHLSGPRFDSIGSTIDKICGERHYPTTVARVA